MSSVLPVVQGMQATLVSSSYMKGTASSAVARVNGNSSKQFIPFYSIKPSLSSFYSSSSTSTCPPSSCCSFSSCIIRRTNDGPLFFLQIQSPGLGNSSEDTTQKSCFIFASARASQTVTAPAASCSSNPNTSAPAAAAAVVQVMLPPAEAAEDAIEDICTEGTLSMTLLTLIRVQEARLFRPSNFNASNLRVLLMGKHDEERPLHHPRIYTLTHSDLTAKITLAVAREINTAQVMGWYNKLQRDEVVAEWRRTQGEMSLHVHCHISGTNFLHMLIAKLRFYIFQKELPLVLEAFMHGDRDLFEKHPELQHAPVWVYFHSNVENYNRVECWGPLVHASKRGVQMQQLGPTKDVLKAAGEIEQQFPGAAVCLLPCECCSRHATVIPIPESLNRHLQQTQLQRRSLRTADSKSSLFRLC